MFFVVFVYLFFVYYLTPFINDIYITDYFPIIGKVYFSTPFSYSLFILLVG